MAGRQLASLAADTVSGLAALSDRPIGDANPVDLGLRAGAAEFEEAARLLVSDPGVDAVLVLYAPSLGATVDEAPAALGAGAAANPSVTVAACFYSPPPDRKGPREGKGGS